MAGGRIGGQGPLFQRVLWVFVACCITVAVWNSFPHDPKGFHAELVRKSEQVKSVARDVVEWLPFDGDGGEQDAPKKQPTKKPPAGKDQRGQR